jgi:hypothetical protein
MDYTALYWQKMELFWYLDFINVYNLTDSILIISWSWVASRKSWLLGWSINYQHFIKLEVSLQYTQKLATGPCLHPAKCSTCSLRLFRYDTFHYFLPFMPESSVWCLHVLSQIKISLLSASRACYTPRLYHPSFYIIILWCKEYKLWSLP